MIANKREFVENMSEEELKNGYIRFYIQGDEHVWGYATPEDKVKYNNNKDLTAILLNWPLSYSNVLHWGDEVKLKYDEKLEYFNVDEEWIHNEIEELKKMRMEKL